MGTTALVTPSGDSYLDGLIAGRRWTSALTWSLPTQAADYGPGYTDNAAITTGFSGFNASETTAITRIVAELNGYIATPLTFLGNNGLGDIRLANSGNAAVAYGYYPDETDSTGGDVFIGDAENNRAPVLGTYGWHTLAHELGHALGLKHPFESGDETAFAGKFMPLDRDGLEFTVMTYKSGVGEANGYTNEDFSYPQTFMQYDILALQYLYGANYATNSGTTVYTWDQLSGRQFINGVEQDLPGANRIFMTVWDGDGHDTYDFTNYTTNLLISLAPGGWSVLSDAQLADLGLGHIARGNVYNAFQIGSDIRSLIEDALGGSGHDTIYGNEIGNFLGGGTGNDTLYGEGGTDSADGSFGDDIIYGGAGDESIFGGSDTDTIYGGDGDDNLGGDSGNDVLYGDNGLNVLQGWTGDDTMFGGVADDSLHGGIGNDVGFGDRGNDLYFGGDGDDAIYGSEGGDQFTGGLGNDTLSGGVEEDDLDGSFGDDVIFGGDASDSIFGGTGNDQVSGDEGNDCIDGHDDNDTLFGGNGRDTLGGGGGSDTLFGGIGNDVLIGFDEADRYAYSTIAGGSGSDTILDFGNGADKVSLVGLGVVSFGSTLALLTDGTTITSGNGHIWVAGDFV